MGQLRRILNTETDGAADAQANAQAARHQLGLSWFVQWILWLFDALLPAWLWPDISRELLQPGQPVQGRSDLLSPVEDSSSTGKEVVLSIEVRCLKLTQADREGRSSQGCHAGLLQAARKGMLCSRCGGNKADGCAPCSWCRSAHLSSSWLGLPLSPPSLSSRCFCSAALKTCRLTESTLLCSSPFRSLPCSRAQSTSSSLRA